MRKVKDRKRMKNKVYGSLVSKSEHTSLHSIAILTEMIEICIIKFLFNKTYIYDEKGEEINYNLYEYTTNIALEKSILDKLNTCVNMTRKASKIIKDIFIRESREIDLNHSLNMIKLEFDSLIKISNNSIDIVNVDEHSFNFIAQIETYSECLYNNIKKSKLEKKENDYLKAYYSRVRNISNIFIEELKSEWKNGKK